MKTTIFIFLLLPFAALAQVGINTNTPLQEVHVAGSSSKVLIEGLNSPNNVNNLGAGNSSRVYVDGDGDLVLGTLENDIEVLFDVENYLADPKITGGVNSNVVNQVGYGSGYTDVGWPRLTGPGLSTFTLTRPAIVEINYSISWGEFKKGGGIINDPNARIVQCYMYMRSGGPAGAEILNDLDGAPIGLLGANGQFYTNGDTNFGASNNFHNTGTDYVKLPAGTYCPMFRAQLAVSSTGGTGAVQMHFGTGNDEVQIIAHYYN